MLCFLVRVACGSYGLATTDGGKGKRGGLRVIYYWWDAGLQFWLFTIYDKDEMSDLSKAQRETLKQMIKHELEARRKR